ncbi:MAG: hypothetical protein NUV97_04280 [archaeon]|nr:hypothetical protein [archaeon]MCR4323532.1 hypothetical protein [Nanoarchaeota archaeon]
MLLELGGESLFRLFYTTVYYDKILHFINPFFIIFITYDVLGDFVKDKNKRIYFSFFGVLIIGLIWELIEIFLFTFFNVPLVGVVLTDSLIKSSSSITFWLSPWVDTFYDIVLDVLGAFFALILMIILYKKKGLNQK